MHIFIKDLLNVPNSISIIRLLGTPLIAIFWLGLDMPKPGLAVGVIVGITDLFDGILARKLNQITEVGALLDQLGDLIFESISILTAVALGKIWSGWLIIYLFREFTVTVVRTWMYSNGGTLPSSWIGKAKSACIQWAFFLIFLGFILDRPGEIPATWSVAGLTPGWLLVHAGMISFITGLSVGLISAWQYLKAFAAFYVSKLEK